MATFLSSAFLLGALVQAPVPSPESLAVFSARIARDSGDGRAWFALGRLELRATSLYHRHEGAPDTTWVRGTIFAAESAFTRAALLRIGSAEGDSARAFRVFAWAELGLVAWELGDSGAVSATWNSRPADAQLPPVLEELAENFLRACPARAVLLTESDAVTSAAWYLHFARGVRPDVTTISLARYQDDSVFADRVNRDLRLVRPATARGGTREDRVRALAGQRPVCVGGDFVAPPGGHGRIVWRTRPLVWVAGKGAPDDKVPATDFVFAALKLALDANDPWGRSAREIYRRAAKLTPSLCPVLATYGVRGEKVGCK